MDTQKRVILITGAAGYAGAMLVTKFAAREDVEKIIGLDKEPLPEMLSGISKFVYIEHATAAPEWEQPAAVYRPDTVIHAAWQIREMYGKQKMQWHWNVEGSDRVFDFAFRQPSVERLIHFSTVASYGAYPSNTLEHRFAEEEPFRKSDYLYAEEKRIAEEHLEQKFAAAKKTGKKIAVAVVRPAAITGPRGRYMRIRFGLQAALMGQLRESFIHRLISVMVSFVPATRAWCRQFVHEDDVVGIIETLTFTAPKKEYDIFNLCPPGPVVTASDMARAVGKRLVYVHPRLIQIVFFIMWHVSRGRVPTSRGGWKSYSYPIAVDGSKVTREYGYRYKYQSLDAFQYTDGVYESFVPPELRRSRS